MSELTDIHMPKAHPLNEDTNECFVRDTPSTLAFECSLNELLSIGLPYAKTIVCLESTHSTVADVFLYWCGIGASLKRVLAQKGAAFPEQVKAEVRGIFNFRWSEMFEEGPTDAHLSAVYLDPGRFNCNAQCLSLTIVLAYVNSDLFKPEPSTKHQQRIGFKSQSSTAADTPKATSDVMLAHIKFPHIFKRVGVYLTVLLRNEVEHGEREALHVAKDKQASVKKRFESQYLAYAQNAPPFCMFNRSDYETTLDWWIALEKVRGADILAVCSVPPSLGCNPEMMLIFECHVTHPTDPRYQAIFRSS